MTRAGQDQAWSGRLRTATASTPAGTSAYVPCLPANLKANGTTFCDHPLTLALVLALTWVAEWITEDSEHILDCRSLPFSRLDSIFSNRRTLLQPPTATL